MELEHYVLILKSFFFGLLVGSLKTTKKVVYHSMVATLGEKLLFLWFFAVFLHLAVGSVFRFLPKALGF